MDQGLSNICRIPLGILQTFEFSVDIILISNHQRHLISGSCKTEKMTLRLHTLANVALYMRVERNGLQLSI